MSKLHDLKIYGSNTIFPGKYNKVKVAGCATAIGEFEAKFLKVAGTIDCNKKIKIENKFKVSGTGNFKGDINAAEFLVYGTGTVEGDINFNFMKIAGTVDVTGNCEGTEFISLGGANISGLLSADKVEITLFHNCDIKEIGGANIEVKNKASFKIPFVFEYNQNSSRKLNSDVIEGDKVSLENTNCKIVRGHNVVIGKYCHIDRVEYTGTIEKDDNSIVGEVVCLKN